MYLLSLTIPYNIFFSDTMVAMSGLLVAYFISLYQLKYFMRKCLEHAALISGTYMCFKCMDYIILQDIAGNENRVSDLSRTMLHPILTTILNLPLACLLELLW